MKKVERDFIELTRRAINREFADDGFFDETDWEGVFKLAYDNSLGAVVCDAAKSCKTLPEHIRKRWDSFKLVIFVRQTTHVQALCSVIEAFDAAGIDYAVFKGQAISECYPNPYYRYSSDSDILVSEADSQRASKVLESLGYAFEKGKDDKELTFKNEESEHSIELHTSIFENYTGPKIEILKEANLTNPEHRIDLNVTGRKIRTFGVSEHLVYQMFHFVKHFMLDGAHIKFFIDFTLFINKNMDKIDTDYFWKWIDKCNYGQFCENVFDICIEQFGMNPAIMAGRTSKATKIAKEAFLVDCIYGGDEEHRKNPEKTYQMLYAFKPYMVGDKNEVDSKRAGRKRAALFPKPSELGNQYGYAKKNPVLLPVAWVHRFIKLVILHLTGKKKGSFTVMQRQEIIKERLALYVGVGLLDEE